jgi:hypothetical protein
MVTTAESRQFEKLITGFHFSVNERMQLKNLLSRWNVVTNHQPLEIDEIGFQSGKDVLRWIDLRINSTNFYL